MEAIENNTHNPSYKLVQTSVFLSDKFIDLVYGETNEGFNEGLEVYFKKSKDDNHYKSFRYSEVNLPKKYLSYYEFLKQFVMGNQVNNGCKIIVNYLLFISFLRKITI